MIDEGTFECADLITDRLSLEDLPRAIEEIKIGNRQIVKGVYRCEQ